MSARIDYEREIEALHDCFVEWYCGDCDRTAFETVERALDDSFERIAPDGEIAGRNAVIEAIRGAYDTYESGAFEIEIRNVERIATVGDRALVRYEEWQTSPSGTNGRRSTVLFEPPKVTSERPVEWRYLQETWLEPPTDATQ